MCEKVSSSARAFDEEGAKASASPVVRVSSTSRSMKLVCLRSSRSQQAQLTLQLFDVLQLLLPLLENFLQRLHLLLGRLLLRHDLVGAEHSRGLGKVGDGV